MNERPPSLSRHRFLEAAAAGVALSALNRRALAAQSPNNQIVLGMIGVGGMGTGRLLQFLKQPDVRIAAICDVDRGHLDRAVAPSASPRRGVSKLDARLHLYRCKISLCRPVRPEVNRIDLIRTSGGIRAVAQFEKKSGLFHLCACALRAPGSIARRSCRSP